ncbi:MAG: DNA mismatch repair endonuclease MutL, partial [Sporomusaceae bacterium]|nr:DNA mismatch repair endonuclease MutL [Sporomusaceae bacterium]
HPQVSFKLINQQRLVLSTPGTGKLSDAAASLYGHKIVPDILTVDFAYEGIEITGIVAKPNLIKGTRSWQTFIVNERVIQNRMMAKALDNAYHSLLPKSGYPLAVLSLKISPDTVDVNVHPQKAEIKFSNDQLIYQALYRAVKSVLLNPGSLIASAASAPEMSQHSTEKIQQISFENIAAIPHRSEVRESFGENWQPYHDAPAAVSFAEARQALQEQDSFSQETAAIGAVAREAECASQTAAVADSLPAAEGSDFSGELYPLGQVDNCYIIAQGNDGLYIIDQHAAHERILYDKMSSAADRIPSQQLLVPQLLDVQEVEADLILDYQGLFYELGFSLEAAGPATIRLLEVPADIHSAYAEAYIRDILQLLESDTRPTPQALRHSCLQLAACHGAIRAGERLNMRQMQALIGSLVQTQLPYACPHGRPAMIRFTPQDLSRFFKRT